MTTSRHTSILGAAASSWLAMAAACCAGSSRHSTRNEMALADRYARGDGMRRDYSAAAEVLEAGCADDKGTPSACGRLAIARLNGRGVTKVNANDLLPELQRACDRGYWLACRVHQRFDRAAAARACQGSDAVACLLVFDQMNGEDEPIPSFVWDGMLAACEQGSIDTCAALVRLDPESHVTDDITGLVARGSEVATRSCQSGDADACFLIGRPLDDRTLCAAHDYEACARHGIAGDPVALETACDHNVPTACEVVAFAARDADPPAAGAFDALRKACSLGSATACRHADAKSVASGCAIYAPYTGGDISSEPALKGIHGGVPWQPDGRSAFLVISEGALPSTTISDLATRLGAAVTVLVDGAVNAPSPALAVQLEPRMPGVRVADRLGVVRARLGLEFGIVPGTLVRCVRALVATP